MVVCLDEEAACAAGGIEHGLAQARIGDGDHKADHGARSVELARVARGIPHLAQHGLVQRAERVQLGTGGEMNAVQPSWLMKARSSSPVMPSGLAAQSRQR